ncbi:MAG: hypothetical protein J5644_00380 [Bacteroidales bacterium]|nr:hypothetical protein [Bacteroidales bacterium]
MRILKFIGKMIGGLVGLFIALLLGISLFVPVYDFDEPYPFSGEYLHNPYEGMDSTTWLKCNFHAHTRTAGGVANGRNNSNKLLDSVYRSFGFDHIGISNYNTISDYGKDNPGYVPGYEHGYGIFKIHQLGLGARKVRKIDYPLWQTLSMKQHTLNKIGQYADLAIPAHPSFVKKGYHTEDFKYLSNYKLMEVLNGYRKSPAHWDMALSNGHLVYLIGGDDAHNMDNINDPANRFTLINSPINDREHLLSALVAGKAVGVAFPMDPTYTETIPHKIERLNNNLPYLTRASLCGDTLRIAATKRISKAEFIGQNGHILHCETDVDEAFYTIQPTDQYVRTVLTFADGTELWLNPITRHESPDQLYHPRLDHLNYWKTGLLWITYTVIISMVILLFRRRKKLRTKN